MTRFISIFFFVLAVQVTFAQTAQQLEEMAARANDQRERMNLFYRAAEKYTGANPQKVTEMAYRAYSLAIDLNDNKMAALAAYKNAEGYEKLNKFKDAKFRYNRAKESALQNGDKEFAAKSLERMADMARREGDLKESAAYASQAADLRSKGGQTAVAANSEPPPSPAANRPVPNNQAEMNNLRELFRRQIEQLERERQQLIAEIGVLRDERGTLMNGLAQLRQSEYEQAQRAQQTLQQLQAQQAQLAQANQTPTTQTPPQTTTTEAPRITYLQNNSLQWQLAQMTMEKEALDRIAKRKEALLRALQDEAVLDSIAFAQELQEQEYKLQRSRNLRNVLILILAFTIVLGALIYKRYLDNKKQKLILQEKNRIIEEERRRSDELLLNILPPSIADELKLNGKAKAQRYERAAVLFTDFKSFTTISEQLSPEQLVHELDTYFKAFDFIVAQYQLEKIKTIGDAYMCASGLSDSNATPINIVKAALEIQEFLSDMKYEKMHSGEPYFEARVGIHVGPVVAGVVGVKKFAYDIWGDTVNIAARIEEACEPGKVNVSEAVYNEIRYAFKCTYRGKLPAKNKGAIDMYYVEGVASA